MLKNNFIIGLTILILSPVTYSDVSQSQKELLESLPPDQRDSIQRKMEKANRLQNEIDEIYENPENIILRPDDDYMDDSKRCEECIFGYDYFRYAPSTFAPIDNVPVSSKYILGPGDKLQVNLYGSQEFKGDLFISREGNLFIPNIGPVSLVGKTFEDAQKFLQEKVSNEMVGTSVSISLTEIRSISIYLLGEAYTPGKYVMSGLSNVTNALFVSGGVNENGSLREIEIRRNNELIATYDFYDFLLNGVVGSDLKLQDGDVIFIPFIENKVIVSGSFKRPYIYEFKEGETAEDIIKIAGGYSQDVDPNTSLEINSINPDSFSREINYIKRSQTNAYILKNGDSLNISSKSGMEAKLVEIYGEVKNPGVYSLNSGDRITDLIKRSGGYTDMGFSEGAVFLRKAVAEAQKDAFERSADELENTIINIITEGRVGINEFTIAPISQLVTKLREAEPPGRMIVDMNYMDLKTNIAPNIRLQDGDSIYIPERPDSISVVGEVLNSTTVTFAPGISVQEYIEQSGGLNDQADKDKIFVIFPDGRSRLIKKRLFGDNINLLPGSTIVVPRDSRPFDAIKLTEIITPILADLATSAAAIAAISDN
tara:strand:+ start:1936 stop:3726 length:1791 start_codon:yes stop_codon:yes gene_type:complete